jgi:hypothetical protein
MFSSSTEILQLVMTVAISQYLHGGGGGVSCLIYKWGPYNIIISLYYNFHKQSKHGK